MRIAIAGGGTAGHVFPGLALAVEMRSRGHDVFFVGTGQGQEARLVPEAGFELHTIRARQLKRELSMGALAAPLVAASSVGACRLLVRDADAVVGLGGYASVPAALAARRERVPLVLHEQNAVPGLANRSLARIATAVACSFAGSRDRFPGSVRIEVTGNPVRQEILAVGRRRPELAERALAELELDRGRRTVVVFGGSLGALHLNRSAAGACELLAGRADLQILLIAGPAHVDLVRRGLPARSALTVRLLGYLQRMDLAYALADLVVSRAGATTVAEIAVCGLAALLVPYPYATANHQLANARALQRAGAASVLFDDQVTAEVLAGRITGLLDHEERLRAMGRASDAFGRPDASARLADLVLRVAAGRKAAA